MWSGSRGEIEPQRCNAHNLRFFVMFQRIRHAEHTRPWLVRARRVVAKYSRNLLYRHCTPDRTTRGDLLTATARGHKHRHVRRALTLVQALIPLYSHRQHHVAMVHRPCQKGRTIHEPYAQPPKATAADTADTAAAVRGRRGG